MFLENFEQVMLNQGVQNMNLSHQLSRVIPQQHLQEVKVTLASSTLPRLVLNRPT
jgi:pyruvoyl-dependent arginine decarboxylase (PvlArgDC)